MLLSYLSIDWPWKDSVEKYLDLALYTALEEQIILVFNSIENNEINKTYIEFVKIVTNRLHNIITLNYDSLVEEIAMKFNLIKNTEYCQRKIIFEDQYDDDKLLNPNENIIFDNSSDIIRIKRTYLTNVTNEEIDDIFKKFIGKAWTHTPPNHLKSYADHRSKKKPSIIKLHGSIKNEFTDGINQIIPPILDKSKYYSTGNVQSNWKDALRILYESEELNIIGFSFPKTDVSMVFLVQTALNKNNEIRINIINIEPKEKAKEKYSELFPNKVRNINFDYCGIDTPLKCYIEQEFLKI